MAFKNAILNLFGHSIGLINEHQGESSKVKLDATKARREFKMQGWSDTRINDFLKIYDKSSLNSSEFDPNSVMLWHLPAYITQDGKSTSLNYELSKTDISFIRSIYPGQVPKDVELLFKMQNPNGSTVEHPYKGVRIGEYYWMDNNFYTEVPRDWNTPLIGWESEYPMTQARLDKYLPCCFLKPEKYQINMSDFNQYYGIYYNRASINYMISMGKMYENGETTDWELPSYVDYRQLFAMCPMEYPNTRLDVYEVTRALTAHTGANPLAFNIWSDDGTPYVVDVFRNRNTMPYANMYNFNGMPGGSRLNGTTEWANGLGPIQPGGKWLGVIGDIYHLFYTIKLTTKESSITIHDEVDTNNGFSYHWFPARWCRKLSDAELGYRLYVNSANKDIKKLELNDPVPSGYIELPKGYLRGFYVLYLLDNPNPEYTMADIFKMSISVDDNTL